VNVHIIAPVLPPALNGIGDYTAQLAAEVAGSHKITLLTGLDQTPQQIPGVTIKNLFSVDDRPSIKHVAQYVIDECPDWVLLQYNPFAYGKWGLNLDLPAAMQKIKKASPKTKFALMVHEPFVPILDIKHAVMTTWQRWQLLRLGQLADLVFFSIDPWARKFRKWYPGKPLVHLPVSSNIPLVAGSRDAVRSQLGISPETLVLGYFGTFHNFRMPHWVRDAARHVAPSGENALILYVGPHTEAVTQSLGNFPTISEGRLSAEDVSLRLRAMDIYLAPFLDGVSTRRTSLISALQHGVPTVGTKGYHTDEMLSREDGKSLLLADVNDQQDFNKQVARLANDAALRETLSCNARTFFDDNFTWPRIASRMITSFESI